MNRHCLSALGAAALLALSACSQITLAPGAEAIRFTKNADEVRACEILGSVDGLMGIADGNSRYDENQLRNKALAMRADTVLITSRIVNANGVAYRCSRAARN